MNNIFVGNLSFKATKEDLIKLFEPFGGVANVTILEGKKGRSRGYGFVDMPNEEEKNAAIAALEGKEFMWRPLSVSPVMPKVKGEVILDQEPKPRSKSASGSKPRSIIKDNPPNPWRKVSSNSKPSIYKDKGSRPYYGKKGKKSEGPSKPLGKGKSGFKMSHKVSGVPKAAPGQM